MKPRGDMTFCNLSHFISFKLQTTGEEPNYFGAVRCTIVGDREVEHSTDHFGPRLRSPVVKSLIHDLGVAVNAGSEQICRADAMFIAMRPC